MVDIQTSYMQKALELAELAALDGEVPVGAVIVDSCGTIIATGVNRVERDADPSAHAEICAIRAACARLESPRLVGCDLYVTLEPCPMCAQAISFARISRLYFGAYDKKGGGVDHGARVFSAASCHHKPDVYGGIEERVAQTLLVDFFEKRR